MRGMRGGAENYTVPYTAFCLTYSVTLYSYIVSPYIRTKHNNDYASRYRVTAYKLNVSPYICAALYTAGRGPMRRLLGIFLFSAICFAFMLSAVSRRPAFAKTF